MNMLASLKAILFPAASQKLAGLTDAAPAEGAPDFTVLMNAANAPTDAVVMDAAPAVAAAAPDMPDAAPEVTVDVVETPALQLAATPDRATPDQSVALALASRPAAIAPAVQVQPATPAAEAAVDAPVVPAMVAPEEEQAVPTPSRAEPSVAQASAPLAPAKAPAEEVKVQAPMLSEAKLTMKVEHPVQPKALPMIATVGEPVAAPVKASDDADIETDDGDAIAADASAQSADPLIMVVEAAPIAIAPVSPLPISPGPIPPAPVAADAPASPDAPAAPVVAQAAPAPQAAAVAEPVVAAAVLPDAQAALPEAAPAAAPAEALEPAKTERTVKPVKAEAVSLLQLVRDHMKARPTAAAPEARSLSTDAPAASDMSVAPVASAQPMLTPAAAPQSAAPQPTAAATPTVDLSASLGAQVVDMGVSGQWIDGLARDIAGLSANGAQGRFQINADQLGPVQVDIRHGSDGATVSLTVATEAAELALRQDSDRLKQDASLSAVRISEVKVERAPHVAESARADSAGNQNPSQSQSQNNGWQGAGQNMGQSSAQSHMQGRGQSRENNAFGHKGSGDAVVLNHEQAGDMSGDLPRARYA
ncbi:flagellar hook-length control protein FliK [Sphingobium sp.]|uniref:flagellar hook-length control protein FliK n=1 Tax=Sphingobium sp. TaxID=1912891 RepID=UPI00262E241A|nr:flagellar hook-length control protein FliK [Sphingobium sp.]